MDDAGQTAPEAVTISWMARALSLSRSRLYQLIKLKVFPEPSRHPTTNRPYYSREQQEQVWRTKKTGLGANGQIVLFRGPLNFQDGSAYLNDGEVATESEIWYLPQLLEGMEGPSE